MKKRKKIDKCKQKEGKKETWIIVDRRKKRKKHG